MITKEDVERRLDEGESLRSIARSYGITYQSLQSRRRRWGGQPLRKAYVPAGESRWVDNYGYWKVRNPEGRIGWLTEYEHVLVAEAAIGRRLNKDEIVHHIDGDKLNNDSSNLLVCTRSEHIKLHAQLQQMAAELVRAGQILFDHSTKEYTWPPR